MYANRETIANKLFLAGRQEVFQVKECEISEQAEIRPCTPRTDNSMTQKRASCRPPSSHFSSLPDSGGTQEGFCGITGGLKYAYGLKKTSVDRR